MKKQLLLLCALSGITTLSFAQPTLTAANVSPVVNDSFVTIVCDTTGVLPGPSGASQSWNFSSLMPTTLVSATDTGHVVYASAGIGYSLFSTVPGFTSTHALETPSSMLTTYYNESSSKLSTAGLYIDISNNAVYSDPMDIFQFPFTYNTTFTDYYSGGATYLGMTLSESGTVTVKGDAYGSLTLPAVPPSSSPRNFTGVLRVHTIQIINDSLHLFSTTPQVDTVETYTWYQPGYHSALLTINTVSGTLLHNKQVSYAQKQIANHVGVPSLNLEGSLKVFPNPASALINIEFDNNTGSDVKISLTDILGREVATIADKLPAGYNQVSYNCSSVAKGLYLVRLQSNTQVVTRKIEIQ